MLCVRHRGTGLRLADKGNQGLNRHGKGNRFTVASNRVKNAHNVVSFGANNYSAARAGMNGFVRGQAVVEGKQAGGGLPFERAVKLQEASEGTDGFFRISKDVTFTVAPSSSGPGHHGDVIVGRDETTGRVEAEARAEFTFYAEAEQLQLSDRDDGLVKVLRGHNGGRRHGWPSIRRGFLGRSRRG